MSKPIEEIVVREFTKTTGIGNDFFTTVTNNLVTDNKKIIELIANSVDEQAENIWVDINAEKIVVRDDGDGMRESDLDGFLRAGDSNKKARTEQENRNFMGRFGVATMYIPTLGKSYSIDTVSSEAHFVFREDLPPGLTPIERPVTVKELKANGKQPGTTLEISNLNLQKNFNLLGLKQQIGREFSPFRKYRIYVNGEELKPRGMPNATKIHYKEDIPLVGPAEGIFYLTKNAHSDPGIYVYLNDRNVADPHSIVDIGQIKSGLKTKLTGRIFIEGGVLVNEVLLGRDDFLLTPAFESLKEAMTAQVRDIRKIYDNVGQENKSTKILDKGKKSLQIALNKLIRYDIPDINESVQVEFLDMGDDEYPVTFNWDDQIFQINTAHPRLRIQTNTNQKAYDSALVDSVLESIAMERLDPEAKLYSGLNKINDIKAKLYSGLNKINDIKAELYKILFNKPQLETAEVQKTLHPRILYTPSETRNFLDIEIGEMRYLKEIGILKFHDKDEVLGQEIINTKESIRHMVSLHSLIHQEYENAQAYQMERVTEGLRISEEFITPFVKAIKKNGTVGYLIDQMAVPAVAKSLNVGRSSPTGKDRCSPRGNFEMLHHRYTSEFEFGHFFDLNGIRPREVLEFCNDSCLELRKRDAHYSLVDFFRAAVQYRAQ